nr:hypothetical protein [Tanacetum cinerariifolium]
MEEPSHPVFETGAEDQPIIQTSHHPEWFSQPSQQYQHNLLQPLSLIPDNQGRRVIPFEHFINNDLEYLRGGASSRKYTTSVTKTKAADYGHIKWIEELVPRAMRIIAVTNLKIVEWHDYKHLDWMSVRRDDDKIYKFKEGNFKRLCLQDIKDTLLLLVQGKLSNLTVEEGFAFNVSLMIFTRSIVIQRRVEDLQLGVESYQKRLNLTKTDTYRSVLKQREAYTAHSKPRGFIYQKKDKKNRLMRIDELHKFRDGTLNDVRNALDDRLKGIRMQYLPTTIWRKGDMDRAVAMIQAIDKMLKTRRIMRSLERREDDDQEGPSAGSDQGSKRRREGGEHASAGTPSEQATESAGRSTTGSQSRKLSASESAFVEEPVQPTCQMEEPSHPVFETGAEDQPIVQTSHHPKWFSQPSRPPTPDRDWNKSVPAAQGNAQSWISTLAKQTNARSSFNMHRLGVETLTPELLAGPTYELMRGSCNSLTELEYHLEEVYKATTDQLDWVNPEGQQYPHNLLQPLPLIPDNRGCSVFPFEHFINNDLEYLQGGSSSRKYTTSVTKTNAADYGHIKWIEDLVPRAMWI